MKMRRAERQVTDLAAIQEIVKACNVCRLAMQDEEGLYIVPLSPGAKWEGEKLTLYFHCAGEGRTPGVPLRWTAAGGSPARRTTPAPTAAIISRSPERVLFGSWKPLRKK